VTGPAIVLDAPHHASPHLQVPEMTVMIGTLNRCDLLAQSVRSLQAQRCPATRFEILVVDNGSTDGTVALLERFQQELPNFRWVAESRRGLSNARNRGIAEARADLVAFFDDDAVAEPDWIDWLFRVFQDDPTADAAGGRICVRWPNERPNWMPASLLGYYGHCDYGSSRKGLAYPEFPYGSNMVIRKVHLQAVGGFNSALGPTGANLMAAGEQDLFFRLYQLPIKVVYEPAAIVHHWAPPERVTRRWSLRRAFRHGVSTATMSIANGDGGRATRTSRLTRAGVNACAGAVATAAAWVGRAQPDVLISRGATTMYWAGVARGTWKNAPRRAR
jgi:glucosyl-dolichyl phosphate glucuronosyltransferase